MADYAHLLLYYSKLKSVKSTLQHEIVGYTYYNQPQIEII